MTKPAPHSSNGSYDALFLHARRETFVILAIWATCFAWAVPYCRLNGYYADADDVLGTLVLGMPGWVFWGIAVPWIAANVATLWFCFVYFSEDELGEVADDDASGSAGDHHAGGGHRPGSDTSAPTEGPAHG